MKWMSAIILLGFSLFQLKTCSISKKKEKCDKTCYSQTGSKQQALGGPLMKVYVSTRKKNVTAEA